MLCYEFMGLVLMPMYFNILQCILIDILVVKNPPQCRRCGDLGLIPGSGRPPWRRKQQLTPVILPGKFHGQGSLVNSPWCHKELDTNE